MASCSKTSNPYHCCNDDKQDQYQSRNNSSGFLHDYPSHHLHHHHRGHVETSNDYQFLSNRTTHNQEGSQVALTLSITDSLLKQIELALTQEKQQNNHQEVLSQPQPPSNSKASHLPAVFLKIGSWKWESKHVGDLEVKFYYKKKKLVWEFLFGALKKKIEIPWTHVSAINAYVDKDKNGRLEIELGKPPEFYNECKFQPLKHTQWEKTDDFTFGEAQICRRHTILFSPGVLHEHFEKLLQYDNSLLNLSRQPFPIHNSEFFNLNMEFLNNDPVPLSNYDHDQGTVLPSVQYLADQPTSSSFVGHSGSNLPMSLGLTIANSGEQSPKNQIQENPFPPIKEQDDYEPFQGLESIVSDQQLQLDHIDNQNTIEVTTELNCFNIDSICNPFEQNPEMNLNPYGDYRMSDGNQQVGQLNIGPGVALEDYLTDDLSSGDGVQNQMMAYINDDVCSFGEPQFDDVFAIQEPVSWLPSQLNDNNGGYDEGSFPGFEF